MANAAELDALFPLPSEPPTLLAPARWPGITHESGLALARTLKDNHKRWHIFFNDLGFHNHASHHLLAIYSLGAQGPLLEAAYNTHVMRPAFKSPGPIDEKKFHEHLGNEKYYNAYLEFFSETLLEKGGRAVLEEYIFSAKANISSPVFGAPPMQMLSRWMAGLLHPLIHTGYGAEFGLLGMLAEGLAQTAIHPAAAPVLIPPSLFKYAITTSSDTVNASVSRLTALLPSLVLDKEQQTLSSHGVQTAKEPSVHALTVLAQILHNRDFSFRAIGLPTEDKDDNNALKRVIELRGEQLVALAEAWTVDGTNADEVAGKIEELTLMNVLMYGVGGWAGRETSKTKQFKADFFLLHLVTSVLFLPSLVAYLSPSSSSILLRSYFLNSLAWYVARGRPALPIRDFYASVPTRPREHGVPHTAPGKDTLVTSDPSPNPWVPIVQTTLMHPDDHLCKLQRALAHFDRMWGTRQPEYLESLAQVGGAPLEGAELLDGTLWLRVAGLSADRLGWMREGEANKGWDFHGFYE